MRSGEVERPAADDSSRPHQRHQRRLAPRKLKDAMPELPQPNADVLRKKSQDSCRPKGVVVRKMHDWKAVQCYYDKGHTASQCRDEFRINYGAWAMAIRRRKITLSPHATDGRRRHDWKIVQAYYNEGHSVRGCILRFGFSLGAWHKAVKRGEVSARPLGRPLQELLGNGKARTNIKHRLMRAGLLKNRCSECGLRQWRNEPIVIQIDHINGVRGDYRLENLRMLCPNCHSQTETYGRRNRSPRLLHERRDPM